MGTTGVSVIQCPKCGRSLPPTATTCQFCGAALAGVPRPAGAMQSARPKPSAAPSWQEVAYWFLAATWVVSGLFQVLQGLDLIPTMMASFGMGPFLVVMGAVDLILGIGLFFENEFAMMIVKIRSIGAIILALLGVAFAGGDPIGITVNVVYGAIGALQIYVLSVLGDV